MPTGEPAGSTLNVGLFEAAIKGKLIHRSVIAREATQSGNKASEIEMTDLLACPPDKARRSLLEDVFRSAAVAGSIGHVLLDTGDFLSKPFDPLLQLVNRQGAKIFLGKHCQRALRAAGKEVVLVHRRKVDPCDGHVNKSRGL